MSVYYSDQWVTLYHGDCREITAWLSADVLVTDPPYGMAGRPGAYARKAAIAGDNDTTLRDATLTAWGTRPALVFGTWRIPRPAGTLNLLVWDKGADLGKGMSTPWGHSHEEIYVLGTWPPLVPGGRAREGGTPCRVPSVLRVPKPNNASRDRIRWHPTPKPADLMERLIARCPAGVIADPFAGSGATLLAARNLGRRAIGVELDERYCEGVAQRLAQDALFFGSDEAAS